jgi:hypothetical protein
MKLTLWKFGLLLAFVAYAAHETDFEARLLFNVLSFAAAFLCGVAFTQWYYIRNKGKL